MKQRLNKLIRKNLQKLDVREHAFTLIELLVAITIVSVLITGTIVAINPFSQLNKAKDAQNLNNLNQIKTALDTYYNDTGCYPPSLPFGQEWKNSNNTIYMQKVPQSADSLNPFIYETDKTKVCPQWDILFAKLANPLAFSGNTGGTCPISQLANCAPKGYVNGQYACKTSGNVDCSYLLASSFLVTTTPPPSPTPGPSQSSSPTSSPTPGPSQTPTGTPAPTAPPVTPGPGAVTYNIAQVAHSPQFYQATVNPVDVAVGQTQAMNVLVREATSTKDPNGTSPIVSVSAAITTDTGIKTYPLSLTSGTNLDGGWYGSWVVHDTHVAKYFTTFTAKNALGESSQVTIDWVDPCTGLNPGGDWTIQNSCSPGTVDGVDNGNVILNNSNYNLTIQPNSTFVWNPGKALQLSAGAIILAETSSVQQTYLWLPDADGDTYPDAAYTQIAASSNPSTASVGNIGYDQRRYNETTFMNADCAPTNPNPCNPQGLILTPSGGTQITLSWTAPTTLNGPAATGYDIYYCTGVSCTPNTLLVSNYTGGTSYPDTGLSGGTTYGFLVTSRDAGGTGLSTTPAYGLTCTNVSNLVTDVDHDGYIVGTAGIQCTVGSTTINGRTYYSTDGSTYPWLSTSQELSYTSPNNTFAFYPTGTGITGTYQTYTAPTTGTYTIEAWGSEGGNYTGSGYTNAGKGAYVKGDFSLNSGDTLQILVGQQPLLAGGSGGAGGGGGGTFIAKGSSYPTATLLLAAGGGGGRGGSNASKADDAVTSATGTTGTYAGGTGPNGGGAGVDGWGGAGSGFSGNGTSGGTYGGQSYSFTNGGTGGSPVYNTSMNSYGGFGGGGGAGYNGGGGGGGYGGGGSGAGGGGSYNGGANQTNTAGVQTGSGKVVITAPSYTTSTDCYDSNANAYPGQTAWFSVDRGDGSYDYNCDGLSTTIANNQQLSYTVACVPVQYSAGNPYGYMNGISNSCPSPFTITTTTPGTAYTWAACSWYAMTSGSGTGYQTCWNKTGNILGN
jgi:prepilin-type N-terminal cleavage/methylation domain-containing protein